MVAAVVVFVLFNDLTMSPEESSPEAPAAASVPTAGAMQ